MRSVQAISPTPDPSDRVYNLYRNRQRPEIICAVPADYALSDFIGLEQWAFEGSLHHRDVRPSGFNDRAASVGVRFNGFYLFQVTVARGSERIVGQRLASEADAGPEPEALLEVRKHVRKVLLRLVAQHANPDRVIESLCRATADGRSSEGWYAVLALSH
jgi:hypothetical protein